MLIVIFILSAITAYTIYASIVRVPEGYEYIVQRWGMYRNTLTQGTFYIVPYADAVAYKVPITPQTLTKNVSLMSTDGVAVEVNTALNIQVTNSPKAVYGIENYEVGCLSLVEKALISIFSEKSKEEMLTILNADANDTSAQYKTFPQKKRRNRKGRRKQKKPDQLIKYNSPKYAMIKTLHHACVEDMADWGVELQDILVNLITGGTPTTEDSEHSPSPQPDV